MNESERLRICQEWAARLACAIYNGEDWDKQAVASYFHMGEEGLSYWFPGDPPERLTEDDFIAAMRRIFELADLSPHSYEVHERRRRWLKDVGICS